MIRLIYISAVTSWPSDNDLIELLQQARDRNTKQNITGMLLYKNATYLQVLEGLEEDVYDIYASIKKDPRNTGVVTLNEQKISERAFPDWSMGFQNLDKVSADNIPGFIDIFGGALDKSTVIQNKVAAVKLLMSFAKTA